LKKQGRVYEREIRRNVNKVEDTCLEGGDGKEAVLKGNRIKKDKSPGKKGKETPARLGIPQKKASSRSTFSRTTGIGRKKRMGEKGKFKKKGVKGRG